mmetsp:Transcript_22312/g.35675  ORF Transcript_22312/g.35675 Transcript_22312/m.35675 type:complete len:112 (-) Transcript_22312:4195-4530(-)
MMTRGPTRITALNNNNSKLKGTAQKKRPFPYERVSRNAQYRKATWRIHLQMIVEHPKNGSKWPRHCSRVVLRRLLLTGRSVQSRGLLELIGRGNVFQSSLYVLGEQMGKMG